MCTPHRLFVAVARDTGRARTSALCCAREACPPAMTQLRAWNRRLLRNHIPGLLATAGPVHRGN